jgi:hypothetical protein
MVGRFQASWCGPGRAYGELLVAAACQRVEERVREARCPRPESVLDRSPHAVAILRLDHSEVVPDVADCQRRARRMDREGLGDHHREWKEVSGEWLGPGTKLLLSLYEAYVKFQNVCADGTLNDS